MFTAVKKPHTLTAIGLAAVLTGPVMAGTIEPIPLEQEPVVVETDWSGFYGGARIGYGFNGNDEVGHRTAAGRLVASPGSLDIDGVTYGLRLGWRQQIDMGRPAFVYGFELGYDAGSVDDSFSANGYDASSEMNGLLGLRVKLGRTNVSRQTLFYGIVGYVRGDFDYTVAGSTGADAIALNTSDDLDGYSLGLGVEHKLSESLSLTAEWEYLEFGSQTLTDGAGASTEATPKFHNISVGLNLSF